MKPACCYAIAATLFIAGPILVFERSIPVDFIAGVSAALGGGAGEIKIVRDTGLRSLEVR